MIEYAFAFVMGALLTLGSIERTLQAGAGRWMSAGFSAALVSLTTWFGVTAAASHNCILYGAFGLGTVLATVMSAKTHEAPDTKTIMKTGTVMYTFPGANKTTACVCPDCRGTGRSFIIWPCTVCEGSGAIMFQYRGY